MMTDLQRKQQKAENDCKKFVTYSCAEVERTAKTLMRDTSVDMNKTYGKKGHHPSLPGKAPAPDTGTLLQSITHSVKVTKDGAEGEVGSILRNPDYPAFLEYGTSKMKPRPWLSAALIKCQSFMTNLKRSLFK